MLSGSPHGSVMSCQSLAARAFSDDKDMTHCTGFHRSVRFSSESRSSTRHTNEEKKENSGSISLTALAVTPITSSSMSQSAPPPSATFDFDETPAPPPSSCRFPKLEECAHFHYERVCIGTVSIEICSGDDCTDCPEDEGWVCLKVRSHVNSTPEECEVKPLTASWSEAGDVGEWSLYRNRDNLLRLDEMLHRCIYDRKVSGLPNLAMELKPDMEHSSYRCLISDYMHHLSIIADDSINCGPVLNWLQMDNKGHKLLVSNEDSSSINTPAVAAAYSVRKYVSQARDEISFEVGDMISIIDMPGPQESLWWRGKRGFRVGFFPHHCVAVIGDKVPRNMTQPPPIVGSVMMAPIKPVLRKHGKLISLFRSFILSRPSRPSLKQQGILKERVFGCDLGEHLLNSGYDVPLVLVECARAIESRGAVDGVFRLSGGTGLTQRLRAAVDAGARALPDTPDLARDPHAVPSLLKMYFRELPNPLCTYQLYESFVAAMQQPDEATKLKAVRQTVIKLPPPHYRTLAYLMRHLRRISLLGPVTGMTPRNMAIVWAPNLLRAPRHQHALQGVAVQAVVTEFLICYAEELFAQEQGADSEPESIEPELTEVQVEFRGSESGGRRPKSLPVNPPTKLLSLEEARRRGGRRVSPGTALPPASGAIAAAAQPLRPSTSHKPKYIEVGSGPNNLPQYHTVLELPVSGSKRGLKRSPSGWRGLFTRSKQHRARSSGAAPETSSPLPRECVDSPMCQSTGLRPVKSCESLTSETDTLAPLADRPSAPLKHHTRSSSCDSYFEPWQAELADMRLRLSPQERDHHMFSEEDDTNVVPQGSSLCSTPPASGLCSAEPSPRRALRVDLEAANELAEKRRLALEEQVSQLRYIDGESPRARGPREKRHSARAPSPHHADIAKRLCKDRDSPLTSAEFPTTASNVKLRERSSPRKTKSTRYSGLHENDKIISRLSWHGKDGHSTLIKIDWPIENASFSNLTTSTLNSTPITPVTPNYDALETDSEVSETNKLSDSNKHTIMINKDDCLNCNEGTCLKCELKATDYENVDTPEPSLDSDISYKNLNRLSAVSTSSSDHKKDDLKNMTSSHDSSSSYTNSHETNDYECFNFTRPNYINLNTSSSRSSPGSPLKSPLKSTISITFRSPTNSKNTDRQNDRDSIYEDVVLDKNLSIVEEATLPLADACLPTQQACQPDNFEDLIILETPTENFQNPTDDFDDLTPKEAPDFQNDADVYSQVKFFKKSIEEVNALITEKEESKDRHYENLSFDPKNDYENINVDTLNICDELQIKEDNTQTDNGNVIKETKNLNVRELAIRFESPTEQKGPFFEKFKTEIKYPSIERKEKVEKVKETAPKNHKLTKNIARSLDENAFIKEFGEKDRRKSFEVREITNLPDLNLNIENIGINEPITPTTENKISLIQRFSDKKDIKTQQFDIEKKILNFETEKKHFESCKNLSSRERLELEKKADRLEFDSEKRLKERIDLEPEKITERIEFETEKIPLNFETEKKLSRERIEKYKEERRNFLREKYSSQSFRSNPEQLTRIKIKKEVKELSPKFERRNTVDLGQRMRFSLAKSANDLDISPKEENFDRKEKLSPTYNIRDMTALFEHKNNGTG